jgi:hypothetical protein
LTCEENEEGREGEHEERCGVEVVHVRPRRA